MQQMLAAKCVATPTADVRALAAQLVNPAVSSPLQQAVASSGMRQLSATVHGLQVPDRSSVAPRSSLHDSQ